MSASPAITPGSMLPEAASIAVNYPQFRSVSVHADTKAHAAWEGTIQPFTSDNAARMFLRSMEADVRLGVSEGTLLCGDKAPNDFHWADPFLLGIAERCRVLVLSFAPPVHARSYLLNPEFSRAFLSYHPHPRADLEIRLDKRTLSGLCVYSAAEFNFGGEVDLIVEYLDQASLFVARHLIWLRTRRLHRFVGGKRQLIYSPKPGELIVDTEVGIRNAVMASVKIPEPQFWDGYWPGRVARASGREHLSFIKPDKECWCGSGQPYGSCHRPVEELMYKVPRR
jgi:hypothetical protein